MTSLLLHIRRLGHSSFFLSHPSWIFSFHSMMFWGLLARRPRSALSPLFPFLRWRCAFRPLAAPLRFPVIIRLTTRFCRFLWHFIYIFPRGMFFRPSHLLGFG